MSPSVSIFFFLGLITISAVVGLLFRRMSLPGGKVMAGLVVGIILGGTIFGRLAPELYENMLLGGQEERVAYDDARNLHSANGFVHNKIRSSQDTRADQVAEEEALEKQLKSKWKNAQWNHQFHSRILIVSLCTLLFLLSGSPVTREKQIAPDWYATISIGLWQAVLPGALVFLVLRLVDFDVIASLAGACAVAVGPMFYAQSDLDAADDAELGGTRLMAASGRIATLIALITLGWAAHQFHGPSGLLLILPAAGAVAGWLCRWKSDGRVRAVVDTLFIPGVAALVACRVDLVTHVSLLPVIAVLLLCGDGRWFGAFLGAMLAGQRRSLRTMRLVLPAMSAESSQLAFAAIALYGFLIPEEIAVALLLGAALMDMTTNARRKMADSLEETEEELNDLMHE